ncbi:unnamed protein product [Caenorhabditis sp. 36 PRJEB53466]|nr:unnamed protein product [Caenorhabditis sp. 36 PRJEB53466]
MKCLLVLTVLLICLLPIARAAKDPGEKRAADAPSTSSGPSAADAPSPSSTPADRWPISIYFVYICLEECDRRYKKWAQAVKDPTVIAERNAFARSFTEEYQQARFAGLYPERHIIMRDLLCKQNAHVGKNGESRKEASVRTVVRNDPEVRNRFDTIVGGEERSDRQVGREERSDRQVGREERSDRQVGGEERSDRQVGGEKCSDRQVGGEKCSDRQVGGEKCSDRQVGGEKCSDRQVGETEPSEPKKATDSPKSPFKYSRMPKDVGSRTTTRMQAKRTAGAHPEESFLAGLPMKRKYTRRNKDEPEKEKTAAKSSMFGSVRRATFEVTEQTVQPPRRVPGRIPIFSDQADPMVSSAWAILQPGPRRSEEMLRGRNRLERAAEDENALREMLPLREILEDVDVDPEEVYEHLTELILGHKLRDDRLEFRIAVAILHSLFLVGSVEFVFHQTTFRKKMEGN